MTMRAACKRRSRPWLDRYIIQRRMTRAWFLALFAVVLGTGVGLGCRQTVRAPAVGASAGGVSSAAAPPSAIPPSTVAHDDVPADPAPRPLRRCFSERPAWEEAPVADLLDRAGKLFDADDFEGALACSEEAARQELPGRARELIGKEPDIGEEFDVEATIEGAFAVEELSRRGLAFES